MKRYMLDTCICAFVMREMPLSVLERLTREVAANNRIVISAITYAEMRYGQIGRKAPAKLASAIDAFVHRLHGVLPWDRAAVDMTLAVRQRLAAMGTPIGDNDAAIAAHALTTGCVLVSNNVREFARVAELIHEDWTL